MVQPKGLILLTDHVCSMKKDRVNFEDRVLNEIRSQDIEESILVRKLSCRDSADALSVVRDNDFNLSKFRDKTDFVKAYICIGNTETENGGNRFWFSQYLKSIHQEFNQLNIDICFVFTRIVGNYANSEAVFYKDSRAKNVDVYHVKNKSTWQNVSFKEFRQFCIENSVDFIKHDIICPKYWDAPTKDSIKHLSQKIADDFISYGDL